MKTPAILILSTAAIIGTLIYLKQQPQAVEVQINGMNTQEIQEQQNTKEKILAYREAARIYQKAEMSPEQQIWTADDLDLIHPENFELPYTPGTTIKHKTYGPITPEAIKEFQN